MPNFVQNDSLDHDSLKIKSLLFPNAEASPETDMLNDAHSQYSQQTLISRKSCGKKR
jgi:hypothetical protein